MLSRRSRRSPRWAGSTVTARFAATAPSEVVRPPARLGRKTFDFGNRLTQPGTFVARWALDRVGPLDEEFQLAMDFDLWLRLLDAGVPAAYIPEALAVFEIHSFLEDRPHRPLGVLPRGGARASQERPPKIGGGESRPSGSGRGADGGRSDRFAAPCDDDRALREHGAHLGSRGRTSRGSPGRLRRGSAIRARPGLAARAPAPRAADAVDVGNLAEDDRPRRPPGGACNRSASTQAIARTVTVNSQYRLLAGGNDSRLHRNSSPFG